jgi:hypothetical protein
MPWQHWEARWLYSTAVSRPFVASLPVHWLIWYSLGYTLACESQINPGASPQRDTACPLLYTRPRARSALDTMLIIICFYGYSSVSMEHRRHDHKLDMPCLWSLLLISRFPRRGPSWAVAADLSGDFPPYRRSLGRSAESRPVMPHPH